MSTIRQHTWLAVAPLLLVVALSSLSSGDSASSATLEPAVKKGRLLVIIIDSLREQALVDHMPHTLAIGERPLAHIRDVNTCSANFTLPCIQTLLEGRQSPFVAGLHNFTGKRGSAQSLPERFARAGLTQVLISDFTLHSLYGHLDVTSTNVEKAISGDYITRDRHAISLANEALDDPEVDVVYLHIFGTDKVAHHKHPGSEGYIEHFEQVDEALAPLLERLRPGEDHVLITGDHGHDSHGHHTRDSIAIMQGPLWDKMLVNHDEAAAIEQPDLATLLAGTFAVPLPADAESHFIGLRDAVDASSSRNSLASVYLARQRKVLADAGHEGESLAEQVRARDLYLRGEAMRTATRYASLLPLFLLWLMAFLTRPDKPETRRRRHILLAGCPLLSLVITAIAPVAPAALMGALGVIGLGATAWWVHTRREDVASVGMMRAFCVTWALSLIPAFMGTRWGELFHSTGSFGFHIPLFFVVLIGGGVLLSRVWGPKEPGAIPRGVALMALTALPSGVYYYQFGQNLIQGLVVGIAVATLAALATSAGRERAKNLFVAESRALSIAALFLFVVSAGLLLWQHAGGWVWGFHFEQRLNRHPTAAPVAVALIIGSVAMLIRRMSARIYFALIATAMVCFSTFVGGMRWSSAASMLLPVVFLAALFRLLERLAPEDSVGRVGIEAMATWAVILASAWIMFKGFFIRNVDFQFALEMFEGYPSLAVAALTTLAIYGKYGAPLLLGPMVHVSMRPETWRRAAHVFFALLMLKMLCLVGFILFGPLFSAGKMHEVALSDFVFIYGVLLLTWPAYMIARGVTLWRERGAQS